MGQDADVRIEDLAFTTTPPPDGAVLTATPEPGARLGRQNRFSLQWVVTAGGRRTPGPVGHATASVFVAVEHVRAGRSIVRGEICSESDLVQSAGEVGAVLLQRLPRLSNVKGARALRPIAADDVVTRTAVLVRPAVQSGDVVAMSAAVEGVTVLGQAVAQQSGSEGDIIRVVNRESRRPLKARVVGPGRVEVMQ
jgi:flagella basal body P-ring formation protein FlgA